jgi:hypothetical protein
MLSKPPLRITWIAAFALLTSCAHQGSGWTRPIDHKFVADVAPLSPPDSRSLQKYALTLPIFEMTDQGERIRWVSISALRRESRDELVLVGDGAQNSVAIQRISAAESVDQRIRVTTAAQGGGPDPIYELIRVPGGWKRTGMRNAKGAWDSIYRGAHAGVDTDKEAEQQRVLRSRSDSGDFESGARD